MVTVPFPNQLDVCGASNVQSIDVKMKDKEKSLKGPIQ